MSHRMPVLNTGEELCMFLVDETTGELTYILAKDFDQDEYDMKKTVAKPDEWYWKEY